MRRCNRDNKGRFTSHEWNISYMEALSRSSIKMQPVIRKCSRCPLTDEVESFACIAARTDPKDRWMIPVDILPVENEILVDAEFIEAA